MSGEDPSAVCGAAHGDGFGARPRGARTRLSSLHLRKRTALLSSTFLAYGLGSGLARAQDGDGIHLLNMNLGLFEVIQLAVFMGVTGAALLSAIWLIRQRTRTSAENVTLRAKVAELNAALGRNDALLSLRDQRLVIWSVDQPKPELMGALPSEAGAPDERASFLAFGRWLTPRSASVIENAIAALREKGMPFDLIIESQNGAPIEARGRKTPAHAVLRFVSLSETQRSEARLKLENQHLTADYEALLGLADAMAMPFWIRGPGGRLRWVNRAYAQAVESESADAVVREGRELLSTHTREGIAVHHENRKVFEHTVSTVVRGDRRMYSVTDFATAEGSIGIALDVSAMESIREDYARLVRNHSDTLDQLTTAVAKFDADQKLRFYNNAFQNLWDLDSKFLESAPDNALLLDRLRGDGQLAEQPEWRRWKDNLLSVYRAVDSAEHWWHLPDGRTLRVIANPQPKGGVTWVFENLTEKIDLESRYNAAIRVQSETLDSLAEGVAVFGPDGRARLANPAFSLLWGLPAGTVDERAHVSVLRDLCNERSLDRPWDGFVASITGFDDERRDRQGQAELKNGTILRYALVNLPNGQVMLTFIDVTDSVNMERALQDKNDALQKADQLKNDFVQRVSYELRSPLTNIIGFTELLDGGTTGALNTRQKEYVGHIFSSSSVLLTLVNDILDLATVDAGIIELDVGELQVAQAIAASSEMVADRFAEHRIVLSVDISAAPATMLGDENRVRQVLANLLSNAANYAPQGSTVVLACHAVTGGVEFSVTDQGPGMGPEVLDIAFRRFEARANGGRRRGAGLGLSIVKSFVELHGGTVRIDSAEGRGTTVTCFFPSAPAKMRDAAE